MEYTKQFKDIVSKECLCIGLSNSAILNYQLPPVKNLKAVTICPGPNLAYFSKVVTLKDMTDHIYGRTNLTTNKTRPHMFIKELFLNVNYLEDQLQELMEADGKAVKELHDFTQNLLKSVNYYRELSHIIPRDTATFEEQLAIAELNIKGIMDKLERTPASV